MTNKEKNNKSSFWKALIFTIIIFGLGMILGLFFENSRTSDIERNLINSEINLVDEQVRNSIIISMNLSCGDVIESTFDFADRIYREARQLEEYDVASKFTSFLTILHRRYDLLRMMLWTESIEVKKNCKNEFHTIIYLYNYDIDNINDKALQNSMSHLLLELKDKHPDEILLIPMAVNLGLDSINMVVNSYQIGEFPAIIIDEKEVVTELINVEELEKIVFNS